MDISGLTIEKLKDLQERGIINIMLASPTLQQGYTNVSDVPITDLPDFQPFKHLIGQGISYSEARRRYNVTHQTLMRWAQRGDIPILGKDKNRVLIDEGYVAYYAHRYHSLSPGRGRRTDRKF